jgi:N-acyl-D-amino-acid deacylase
VSSLRALSSIVLACCGLLLAACASTPVTPPSEAGTYDVILRGGTVYDGNGGAPFVADVAIQGDTVAAIGDLPGARGRLEVDARGMAVAPGFINMLSWSTESLLVDGRALSELRQGVTLQLFGEGSSMGPINAPMRAEMLEQQGDLKFDVPWTTLGEYLEHLEKRGIAPNVASFVGATTVRIHELGYADRAPTHEELERMRALVRQAMEEGALGVGSSLIYAPAAYAKTDELIALARVAAEHGGIYITHMRSEGNRLLEALDEAITIGREAGLPVELYHLKAAGQRNWGKLDEALARIEQARRSGLRVTTDMYPYTAAATGLDAAMPPWVQEGGQKAWEQRLKDPAVRQRVMKEMTTPGGTWENFFLAAGPAENILLVGFKSEALKPLTGKTLAQVATLRGKSPEETAIDLVIEDGSRISTVYFLMSEDNVRKQLALPYMSICSDMEAVAAEGVFLKSSIHPRAYGSFAKVLGRYARDEKVFPLQEAVRRLSSLPAENLRLDRRGRLKAGHFADVVVFDAAAIQDHATYDKPHQYATGVHHVFVNGVQVLRDGEPTGAPAGRVVRGPGWKGARK